MVEALVTSILSTLVAGVAIFLLQMSGEQVEDGISHVTLAGKYVAVREDIQKKTRIAQVVKTNGDPSGSPSDGTVLGDSLSPGLSNRSEIVLCNPVGDSLAGYRIANDTLHELTGPPRGREWTPMRLGQESVRLDGTNSHFDVLVNRRGVNFYLRLVSADGDTLPAVKETVLCRNAYRF